MLPALFRLKGLACYVLCHILVLFAATITAKPPKPLLMDISAAKELPVEWYRKDPNATDEITSVVELLPIQEVGMLPWLVFLRLMEEKPTGWLKTLNLPKQVKKYKKKLKYKNDEYPLVKIVGEVDIISSAVTMSVTTNDSTTELVVQGCYACEEQKCFVAVAVVHSDVETSRAIYKEDITVEDLRARIGLAFATIYVCLSAADHRVYPLLVHVWEFGPRQGHKLSGGMVALMGRQQTQLSDGAGKYTSWSYAIRLDSGATMCSVIHDDSTREEGLLINMLVDLPKRSQDLNDEERLKDEHAYAAFYNIWQTRSEFHDKRRHLEKLLEVPLSNLMHENDFIMFPLSALKELLSTFGGHITALEGLPKDTITGTTGFADFMGLVLSTSLVSKTVKALEPHVKCKVGVNSKVVDRISELKKLLENDPKLTSAVKEYKNGSLLKMLSESEQALSDFKPNEADVLFDINTREGLEGYLAAFDKPQQQATSPP
eukprot:GHVS01068997.1.p1 GENE.GHVS01068997.1~~GHVS01068997.1.p1  ORF type:complete len:555 (+),score=49.73 GHVS01068997.1:202-1665(+)